MFINCKEAAPQDLYKILIGSVVPRPIAWVSTIGKNGVTNLAPFSFFNCFGIDPPILAFAPGYKSISKQGSEVVREMKDTLRNIVDTNEFVINVVSAELGEQMNQCAAEYPPEVSEFGKVGVTAGKSTFVQAPRVVESPVNFECKLLQLIQHGNNNMVLGEIVAMHVDERVIGERGHIKNEELRAIGRMAGNWYTDTQNGNFELIRPSV
ncbi:MAG TPA: flavin reductase family protein [Drouetiella sp.]